ncbi:MAG: mechanosensitive ion channel domain-containing protein [Terriglobia bacterium]
MKLHRSASFIVLVALMGAAIIGLALTARIPKATHQTNGVVGIGREEELVDQRPLQTARNLAALASTDEERQFAQDALRIADHEVDLAFAAALRAANRQPVAKKNAAMEERIDRSQAHVKQYQAKIKELTAETAKAKGASLTSFQQRLALAQAQLGLAQDELADAQQDMARASGDVYNQIERIWQEHEQTEHANGETRLNPPGGTQLTLSSNSLIARWRAWSGLASEKAQLLEASAYVLNKTGVLTRRHDALEQEVAAGQGQKQTLEQQAASLLKSGRAKGGQGQVATAALSSLRQLSQDEVSLADLDRRIQDLRSLSAIYAQWGALAALRERAALHRAIRSALWILLALFIASVVGRLASQVFDRMGLERKQRTTLHGVVQFAIQALAALVILLVLFGSPNNMFTVLGLAGAGLTVTLKDFVVAFCGWFVLMGRNGVHVGDWVEINGVRGEVVEIGLLRTLLLETGNWTEAGHPTGRQVAFMNSYAVEGYFFNFSTSGQWMWDELPLLIPQGEDPYPLMEKIRVIVAKETETSAQRAEEEWHRAAHQPGVKPFSAEPEINMKPGDSGIKLIIRYITKASERYEVRARLSHAIVKMLHHGEELLPPPQLSGSAAAEIQPQGTNGPDRPAGPNREEQAGIATVKAESKS